MAPGGWPLIISLDGFLYVRVGRRGIDSAVTVLPDGFHRTLLHGLLAEFRLVLRGRLNKDIRIAVIFVCAKVLRGSGATEVAVNTLDIYVPLARDVSCDSVFGVCHEWLSLSPFPDLGKARKFYHPVQA